MSQTVIRNVKRITHGQWCGEVQLPGYQAESKILIVEWRGQLRAVSRYCPHKDYDLIGCPVNSGGVIVCPWHGLPVSVSDPKMSFPVLLESEVFYILPNP